MRRAAAVLLAIAIAATMADCKRSPRARVSAYARPALPAGFVEHSGTRWRVAAPSTWQNGGEQASAVWEASDPQAVDEYHANANVVVEAFAGESYEYARANEESLRVQPRATVAAVREDVVDGDPTLILESRWQAAPPSTTAYLLMQTALASRGTGYVVTCAAAAKSFERYRSTCESIVRSIAVER